MFHAGARHMPAGVTRARLPQARRQGFAGRELGSTSRACELKSVPLNRPPSVTSMPGLPRLLSPQHSTSAVNRGGISPHPSDIHHGRANCERGAVLRRGRTGSLLRYWLVSGTTGKESTRNRDMVDGRNQYMPTNLRPSATGWGVGGEDS